MSRSVKRFEAAVRAHEMMGAQHPADHQAIVDEYEAAKRGLMQLINSGNVARDLASRLQHPDTTGQ